jgi:hypothetical protein
MDRIEKHVAQRRGTSLFKLRVAYLYEARFEALSRLRQLVNEATHRRHATAPAW